MRLGNVRFVDAALTAEGMEPLPLTRLATKAHEMGLVVAAMVHGYNRWAWVACQLRSSRWTLYRRDRRARSQIRRWRVGSPHSDDDDRRLSPP